MILLTILLVYLAGFCLMLTTGQHKRLGFFEIAGLSFGSGLSLVVATLFVQGILFDHLSIVPGIVVVVLLLLCFVLRHFRETGFVSGIFAFVKAEFLLIKGQVLCFKGWRMLLLFLAIAYILLKLYMAFAINVSHPTIAEDAIVSWDFKTKVFFENRSLVLDYKNPEFLGGATKRSVFAPLADLFFIILYQEFPVGLSNIISPLVYLNLCLILFGIFLRKTNLAYAVISVYVLLSLPLVFTHAWISYFNLPSSFFLFAFAFYFSDWVLGDQTGERGAFLIPLAVIAFLAAGFRTEDLYFTFLVFFVEHAVFFLFRIRRMNVKRFLTSFVVLVAPALVALSDLYLRHLAPRVSSHFDSLKEPILTAAVNNIFGKTGLFMVPFEQIFLRPEFNLLYLFFIFTLILLFFVRDKVKEILPMLFALVVLFGSIMAALYAYWDRLALMTHYCARYMILLTPFIIYVGLMIVFIFQSERGIPTLHKEKNTTRAGTL
ncbi:MAG: hypothetical protein HQM16_06280 [Deltaproteobacteria bacterium]|nr:hypothetical protein [Deltaproteobacteria bacterium]